MDFPLLGAIDVLWLPFVGAAFGLGYLIEYVRRRQVEKSLYESESRVVKERERVAAAERELADEKSRAAPSADAHHHLLNALSRSFQELASARDRTSLFESLAPAIERTADPSQFMVFVASDREGREFRLVAAGGERGAPWEPGALLNDAMGRVGLVARRRTAMDRRQFEIEPPIVREQLEQSEPAGFLVEVAVPVVVQGGVAAILAAGGSTLSLDATRGGLELLATHAAAVLRAIDVAARIERLKNSDEMTGLGSKGWFVAEGAEEVYRRRTDSRPAGLVILGIDDFRGYVLRTGHAAGDRLLRGVADVMRPLCDEGVLLARWSGAEFVALLPGASAAEARLFAERMRSAVAAVDWPEAASQPRGRLTMSAGVAVLPANGQNLDELIESAAETLAAARWSGDVTHSCAPETAPGEVPGETATEEIVLSPLPESVPPPSA